MFSFATMPLKFLLKSRLLSSYTVITFVLRIQSLAKVIYEGIFFLFSVVFIHLIIL